MKHWTWNYQRSKVFQWICCISSAWVSTWVKGSSSHDVCPLWKPKNYLWNIKLLKKLYTSLLRNLVAHSEAGFYLYHQVLNDFSYYVWWLSLAPYTLWRVMYLHINAIYICYKHVLIVVWKSSLFLWISKYFMKVCFASIARNFEVMVNIFGSGVF